MNIFIAELIGTFMLLLLGDSVVANVTLNKSGMKGAGSIQITLAWGLAVMVPAFIFGATSGAHFNPALSIALAIDGSISFGDLPFYLAGELLGAFLGACLVYVLFKGQFDETPEPGAKLGVFCTGASIPNVGLNLLAEIVATFVLVFSIKGIGQVTGIAGGLSNFLVFGIIVSIGMSFGGLTGYALNPARDFCPRLAHAILPIKGKGDSNWGYAWIPIVGPIIGAIIAVLLYSGISGFLAG